MSYFRELHDHLMGADLYQDWVEAGQLLIKQQLFQFQVSDELAEIVVAGNNIPSIAIATVSPNFLSLFQIREEEVCVYLTQ